MSYSVLLFDKDPNALDYLVKLIDWKSLGYFLLPTVSTIADAIKMLDKEEPAVMISDVYDLTNEENKLLEWAELHHPSTSVILTVDPIRSCDFSKMIHTNLFPVLEKPANASELITLLKCASLNLIKKSSYISLLTRQDRQFFLSKLVSGSNDLDTDLENEILRFGLHFSKYVVLSVQRCSSENSCGNISNLLVRLISEKTREQCYKIHKTEDNFYILICVSSTEIDLNRISCEVLDEIKIDYGCTYCMGISNYFSELSFLRRYAVQADDSLQYGEKILKQRVTEYLSVPPFTDDKRLKMNRYLLMVEDTLETLDKEAITFALENFSSFIDRNQTPPEEIRISCRILIASCLKVSINYNVDTSELLSFYDKINTIPQYNLLTSATHLIHKIMRQIDADINTGEVIKFAKKYMQANYNKNINLDDIAKQVHLNSGYFSKLFKKKTGQNVMSYLQSVRVNAAKELLWSTNKKAYEIADMVGIYDPVYFSKIFKKHTGLNPNEYRSGK